MGERERGKMPTCRPTINSFNDTMTVSNAPWGKIPTEHATFNAQTHTHLQVGCEGIRKTHVTWESTQDQIAHLNAVRRRDITEREMIVTQELREVMKKNKENSEQALRRERERERERERACCISHVLQILSSFTYK